MDIFIPTQGHSAEKLGIYARKDYQEEDKTVKKFASKGWWGDLLRSLPHIKTEVKLNFQANSESNSK